VLVSNETTIEEKGKAMDITAHKVGMSPTTQTQNLLFT
jgi:hypothetical protein